MSESALAAFARPTPARFLMRAAWVCAGSAVVAFLMVFARNELTLPMLRRTLAYSEAIALCSWVFIDVGRFLLRPHPDSGWPVGGRGVALSVFGCAAGFAAGQALGDLINGYPIYSGYAKGLRNLKIDILVTAVVGALFSGYYYLRGRTAHHAAQLARTEQALTLARLAALQSQLEPHMLFNTLANLRVLIGLDPPRAQAMLDRMIAYLRATLEGSRTPLHSLAQEYERLADYLALMAVRMGPRLQVQLDLPEALRAVPVPSLLLQPLVENGIKHGLEPAVAGGRIEVTACRQGDQLALCVRDTGVGLAPDHRTAGPGGSRFGLAQVRERLAALYGTQASLTLEDAADGRGGVLACVALPVAAWRGTGP